MSNSIQLIGDNIKIKSGSINLTTKINVLSINNISDRRESTEIKSTNIPPITNWVFDVKNNPSETLTIDKPYSLVKSNQDITLILSNISQYIKIMNTNSTNSITVTYNTDQTVNISANAYIEIVKDKNGIIQVLNKLENKLDDLNSKLEVCENLFPKNGSGVSQFKPLATLGDLSSYRLKNSTDVEIAEDGYEDTIYILEFDSGMNKMFGNEFIENFKIYSKTHSPEDVISSYTQNLTTMSGKGKTGFFSKRNDSYRIEISATSYDKYYQLVCDLTQDSIRLDLPYILYFENKSTDKCVKCYQAVNTGRYAILGLFVPCYKFTYSYEYGPDSDENSPNYYSQTAYYRPPCEIKYKYALWKNA